MSNNLTTQDSDLATVPTATAIATVQLSDNSHAGYAVVGDPTTRTQLAGVTPKGTQATNALAVQPLKDAGRVSVALTIDLQTTSQTGEIMIATMKSSNGLAANVSSLTNYTVTTGKTLRLQTLTITVSTTTSSTTRVATFIRLRAAVSGAISTSSPIQGVWSTQGASAVNDSGMMAPIFFPDGFEFPSASTLGFSVAVPGWVSGSASPIVSLTAIGYEY